MSWLRDRRGGASVAANPELRCLFVGVIPGSKPTTFFNRVVPDLGRLFTTQARGGTPQNGGLDSVTFSPHASNQDP